VHFRSHYIGSDGAYIREISDFQMSSNTESLDLYSNAGNPWKNATVYQRLDIDHV